MTDSLFARLGRDYPAGSVLFREGEDGAEMFVIQSGRVQLTKHVGGAERPLATLGRGEFLGEMAILNAKPRTATAVITEDARCLVIDAPTLEMMVTRNPEIAMRLIKKLAVRLDSADALVQILMNPDPKARVMLALRRHAEAFGEETADGSGGIRVLAPPHMLAREVGVGIAEELVHEVLNRLRRLRIIDEGSAEDGIVIPDVGRLLEFLEFLDMPQTRRAEGS
jgi:CRP-like cAMP-binding protein